MLREREELEEEVLVRHKHIKIVVRYKDKEKFCGEIEKQKIENKGYHGR